MYFLSDLSLETTIGISAGVLVIAFILGMLITSFVCPDVARKFMSRWNKTRTNDLECKYICYHQHISQYTMTSSIWMLLS